MSLTSYVERHRRSVETTLERLLAHDPGPADRVVEAMRYAVTAGGKRLRPLLVLASAEACGADPEAILEPAAALELFHTYSLIHDDLPAMDDDDLRRGRPTVHKAFGEAEAILAGDALQTLAFEVLGRYPDGDGLALRRARAVVALAHAAGIEGMVGGQIADLEAERRPVDAERLTWIHRHKTGALFRAACEIGAIHGGAGPEARSALSRYGEALGLAFQIADDLLDRTASAADLGKTPGKDEQSGKSTYPALYGMDGSRRLAETQVSEAIDALRDAGLLTVPLEQLARFSLDRAH